MKSFRVVAWFVVLLLFVVNTGAEDEIGVDEHLGQVVPSELAFVDEYGETRTLGELVDRPTVITMVYYKCPGLCSALLNNFLEVVEECDLTPGKDYKVLTISFNPEETPDLAISKKKNYLGSSKRVIPEEGWKFLTGSRENIRKLTEVLGYRYKRVESGFLHPSAIVFLSQDRKISRYLRGMSYLPLDLKMSVIEAAEGKVGSSINRVLKLCFSYDPEGRKYVFEFNKVAGILVTGAGILFFLYLTIFSRKNKRRASREEGKIETEGEDRNDE